MPEPPPLRPNSVLSSDQRSNGRHAAALLSFFTLLVYFPPSKKCRAGMRGAFALTTACCEKKEELSDPIEHKPLSDTIKKKREDSLIREKIFRKILESLQLK